MDDDKPAAPRKHTLPKRPRKKPPKRPPKKKLPRKPPKARTARKHRLVAPYQWLLDHPRVANAIKWQFRPADLTNNYMPPAASDKVAFPNWTSQQKAQLRRVYLDCVAWFEAGAHQEPMAFPGLTDIPANLHSNANDDTVTAMQQVDPSYMWDLYLGHVGFSLAAEITQRLPWKIGNYDDTSLRYLFDSTTMAWNLRNTVYAMGTYAAYVPALRADNLPKTPFGPPMWTYPFLAQAGLIGMSRLDTIGRVLQWMRENLTHFFGADTFGTCAAVWQYRGYPPLSRIVAGTVDANNPGYGTRKWTLGCHGSVGFLNAVLRVVNIPVQPVWVCGHELACFVTERLYLDHGDDPYNQNVRNSAAPVLTLLIDEPTYQARFTNDLTVNIDDVMSPGCASVGLSAQQFPP